jgi:hypothetical protein
VLALILSACAVEPEPDATLVPIQELSWVSEEERAAGPPHARWDMVATLREDQASVRHPSDGGGRAWLELASDGSGASAVAGRPGSWTVIYEVGPAGIAEGGIVGLQVSPFWGWSTPQVNQPEGLGYTEVSLDGDLHGLELEAQTWGEQLLGISIQGRALEPGERIRIHYGAGPAGALADRYAEEEARLWIAVDGDGDGIRGLLADSPSVRVEPGPAVGLMLTLPGTLAPGATGRMTLAAVDANGNAGAEIQGEVLLEVIPPGLALPGSITMRPSDQGTISLDIEAPEEGLFRVQARGPAGLIGQSNPVLVSAHVPRVLWGDLHGHSSLSDGTGSPGAYYRYARDVAGLDFAALTDHDHWGMRFMDQQPELWDQVLDAARRYHDPGRFVTVEGYEWTSWIHGHRHVLFFGGGARLYSSMDPATDEPGELWRALEGAPQAITVAHHSGGGPIPIDWSSPPDPALEPMLELCSVHGVSEALDAPGLIYSPVPGAFGRDALDMGHQLGFMGGGDSHDGHPGLAWLASSQGGLVAVLDAELSRPGLYQALRSRRAYATNGARTLLFTTLDGQAMGSSIPPTAQAKLVLFAVGDAPLEAVELIRSGQVVQRIPAQGEALVQASLEVEALEDGEYLYLRVLQRNGGLAVSSPFFVRNETAGARLPASDPRRE